MGRHNYYTSKIKLSFKTMSNRHNSNIYNANYCISNIWPKATDMHHLALNMNTKLIHRLLAKFKKYVSEQYPNNVFLIIPLLI